MKRTAYWLALGALMAMNAQASAVVCDPAVNPNTGLACGGSGPRVYVYAVTADVGITSFQVGWLLPNLPANVIVYNSLGISQAFACNVVAPPVPEDVGPYEPHGTLNTIPSRATKVLLWDQMNLPAGDTYYFGYDASPIRATAGWSINEGTFPGGGAADEFAAAVGGGVGPVHIPIIPEPTTVALAAMGAGLFVLRRRSR